MLEKLNPDKVEDTEIIGRSLHGSKATDAYSREWVIKWNQFYDSRLDDDLSVDRLGNYAVNIDHVEYLIPKMPFRKPATFQGWGVLDTGVLRQEQKLTVYVDPVVDSNPLIENPLHAQISRTNHRDIEDAKDLAKVLAHIATDMGVVLPPKEEQA